MAVPFRLHLSFLFLFFHSVFATLTGAHQLAVLDPNVVFDLDQNGTTVVYSPITGQHIPQGLASDGSGSGFSISAVLWVVFSFLIGAPLLFAGFRGRCATLGAAVGLAAALASWAVIVNALDDVGISDVILTISIFVLFILGFALGSLDMSRILATLVLGSLGGLAIGVRITLLRNGLLISSQSAFFVNWLIIGVCGIAGSTLVLWKQRFGILNGCASAGSFLCALGFDLIINQQSGMSRGLRYLMDRNRFHVLDNVTNGYLPPTTTVIILAVSLGVTPAFAFAQWKAFKRPFFEAKRDTFVGPLWDLQEAPQDEESASVLQRSKDVPDLPTAKKPPHQLSSSHNAQEGGSS